MSDSLKFIQNFRMFKVVTIASAIAIGGCAAEDPQQFIKEGRVLFEKGDMESARVQFRNALQIDPKLAEAYYGLALIDEKMPDLISMRKNLQEVVAIDPSHYDAQVKLGLLTSEQKDAAREKLSIAQKLDPENINTILLESKILFTEKKYPEALRQLDRALAKDETNGDAIWLQTSIFFANKRYDDALAALSRGIQAHPDNLALGLLKVLVHKEQQLFDDVARDFEELIAKHPDDKKLRQNQIQTLAQIGKPEQAEQALRDAVSAGQADTDLKLTLVNFIEPRDVVKAEATLKDFLAASPGDIKLKMRLAGYYIGRKRTSEAETLLKEIVAADPSGKDGLASKVLLAELAWAQNDKVAAEALAEEVIKVDGSNSAALLFRASMRLTKQDVDGAISDLRIVLRDQPNSDQALVMMAQAYAMKGEPEVAESHWRKAFEANPTNYAAIAPLISVLHKRGDMPRAEELLTKSLNANSSNPAVLELLIKLRAEQNNWAGAESSLNELKKLPQASIAAKMLEGLLAAGQGRHLDAIQAYKAVLVTKTDSADALVAMARSYDAAGQRSEFFTFLKAFIQQNPNSVVAHNALGMAYASERKWAEASKPLYDALKQDPKAIATYKLLATVLVQQGKAADVPELYRKGLAASPDSSELMLALAKFYDGSKDYTAAIDAYNRLLDKHPDNDEAANNLAYLQVEFGSVPDRFERAVALTERFRDTSNPYFLDTYGWALFKSGKAEQSIDVLKKTVSVVPDNAEFRYHLGEAFFASGDKDAAKLHLEKSLSLAGQREFSGIGRVKELLKQIGTLVAPT